MLTGRCICACCRIRCLPERRRLLALADIVVSLTKTGPNDFGHGRQRHQFCFRGNANAYYICGQQQTDCLHLRVAERRRQMRFRIGNPAVIGIPLDRWLCDPLFQEVCLCQTNNDRCTGYRCLSIATDIMFGILSNMRIVGVA